MAVSNIEEAIQLRENSVSIPILILGYTPIECAQLLSDYNITQCVYCYEYAKSLSEIAIEKQIKVHLKIDTGMGRIGFKCTKEELDLAKKTCQIENIIVEGIFTHFSVADEGNEGEEYTVNQYNKFVYAISELQRMGIEFKIKHCANSATIFEYPAMHMDMVRAGIVLYGLEPSKTLRNTIPVKPILELKTVVSYIKELRRGDRISYGSECICQKDMKIATLPIGYADGLLRTNYRNGMCVCINEIIVPIVGRICMDQCMVDVTECENISIGDEV